MKNKKTVILILFLLGFIAASVYLFNSQNGNSVDARQRILSKRDNHVIILREINIENSIISEFIDQESGYGYAQFEGNEKGRFILKSKLVKTRQDEPILADTLVINDEAYDILMCNTPCLEYAEVAYTDETTGKMDDPIRVGMNSHTVELIKAPEYLNYTMDVVFYNYKGEKFE